MWERLQPRFRYWNLREKNGCRRAAYKRYYPLRWEIFFSLCSSLLTVQFEPDIRDRWEATIDV